MAVLPSEARRKRKVVSHVAKVELPAPQARRLSYYYQEGIKQKLAGKISAANDLFQHCLDINPDCAEAIYELGYIKFYLNQDSLGTALLRRASELEDRNPWYKESLAAAYLARNEYDNAIPVLEQLSKIQTRRTDVLYQLMGLYKANKNTEEAISVLNRIELLEGPSYQTGLQKFALLIGDERREEAFAVLDTMERDNPRDMRIPLTRGNACLEYEDFDGALACFQRVKATDPDNLELPLSMMEYYAKTGQPALRQNLRDSLLYAKDTDNALRRQLANAAIQDFADQPERIMQMLDTLVQISPSTEMYAVRASYLIYSKANPDSVAVALRQLLTTNPENETALNRLLVYYLDKQDMDNIIEICHLGINAYPDAPAFHFYLGVALAQQKRLAEAEEALKAGIGRDPENKTPEYVSDIYGLLGDIYYEQGRTSDAFAAYDSCLVYMADNASCLNNYAYYLSLRRERLDEAEKMSYRAIKLEPLNKTYLDTYAWVLFEQENYVMAKFYIDRVVSASQSDSTLLADDELHADVLEHAGDIYFMNNNAEQACRYWTLARQKGEGSALLDKKLKLKKYVKE